MQTQIKPMRIGEQLLCKEISQNSPVNEWSPGDKAFVLIGEKGGSYAGRSIRNKLNKGAMDIRLQKDTSVNIKYRVIKVDGWYTVISLIESGLECEKQIGIAYLPHAI